MNGDVSSENPPPTQILILVLKQSIYLSDDVQKIKQFFYTNKL